MKKYDAQYFIKKFAAIPDELWGCGAFERDGRYCALGHCGIGQNDDGHTPDEANALSRLFGLRGVPCINDGTGMWRELGTRPRERILNALILVEAGVWEEIV